MKVDNSLLDTIEDMCFRVVAHVMSRLRRRAIEKELDRLKTLPKTRGYLEVSAVLASLFGLALLGASFGVWGLATYFLFVVIFFR